MKIDATFSHSIISELNMKVNNFEPLQENNSVQSLNSKLGIHEDLDKCYVELMADIRTDKDGEPIRTFEITMLFFFELNIKNIEKEMQKENIFNYIYDTIENDLVRYSRHQLRETIIQITSIDYFGPIFNESVSFNF